jgi:hypothetical protein
MWRKSRPIETKSSYAIVALGHGPVSMDGSNVERVPTAGPTNEGPDDVP